MSARPIEIQRDPLAGIVPAVVGTPRPRATQSAVALSMRGHMLAGYALIIALFVCFGGWMATTELSGAVIAGGVLVVETSTKKVQHPSGGVVMEVNVKDGDIVRAGDLLIRLDETIAKASLEIVSRSLDEMRARQARLMAEREGTEDLNFDTALQRRAESDQDMSTLLEGERRVFALRRAARGGKRDQLQKRIVQFRETIRGVDAQLDAKEKETTIIRNELASVRELFRQKLVSIQRLNQLERDTTRITGDIGQLIAARAEAAGRIAETELAIIQIDQDFRSEVASELREIDAKIAELRQREVAARQTLDMVEVRAPQDGIVQQLTVHVKGSIIAPNETVLMLVPTRERLVVDVQVTPQDIDQLVPDQPVSLHFSGLNQRTTPVIEGQIVTISADRTVDPRDPRIAYYQARVTFAEAERAKLGPVKLVPGMPVEAFISTGQRTALSYVLKPITEQIARAFKYD